MENSKSTDFSTPTATTFSKHHVDRTDGNLLAAIHLGSTRAKRIFRAASRQRSPLLAIAIAAIVFSALGALTGSPHAAEAAESDARMPSGRLELVMLEEKGCGYCRRWHKAVGLGYGLSDEGKIAPLKRIDLASAESARFARIVYTPTFVLLRDGEERGRITGYPGADFFWTMLSDRLSKLDPKNENPVEASFDPFNPYQDCD